MRKKKNELVAVSLPSEDCEQLLIELSKENLDWLKSGGTVSCEAQLAGKRILVRMDVGDVLRNL